VSDLRAFSFAHRVAVYSDGGSGTDYWRYMFPGQVLGAAGGIVIFMSANVGVILAVESEAQAVAGGFVQTVFRSFPFCTLTASDSSTFRNRRRHRSQRPSRSDGNVGSRHLRLANEPERLLVHLRLHTGRGAGVSYRMLEDWLKAVTHKSTAGSSGCSGVTRIECLHGKTQLQ
jgi:hypothetical protein